MSVAARSRFGKGRFVETITLESSTSPSADRQAQTDNPNK